MVRLVPVTYRSNLTGNPARKGFGQTLRGMQHDYPVVYALHHMHRQCWLWRQQHRLVTLHPLVLVVIGGRVVALAASRL